MKDKIIHANISYPEFVLASKRILPELAFQCVDGRVRGSGNCIYND